MDRLTITLDCPNHCGTTLRFTTDGADRARRGPAHLWSRCPSCGTSYDLFGGQLRPAPNRTAVPA